MDKKITNEEIAQFIGKIADKLREDTLKDLEKTKQNMENAEKDLVSTFNFEQKALYDYFVEARKEYYKIANDVYQKKF